MTTETWADAVVFVWIVRRLAWVRKGCAPADTILVRGQGVAAWKRLLWRLYWKQTGGTHGK